MQRYDEYFTLSAYRLTALDRLVAVASEEYWNLLA